MNSVTDFVKGVVDDTQFVFCEFNCHTGAPQPHYATRCGPRNCLKQAFALIDPEPGMGVVGEMAILQQLSRMAASC
jgi:hypothetical protein